MYGVLNIFVSCKHDPVAQVDIIIIENSVPEYDSCLKMTHPIYQTCKISCCSVCAAQSFRSDLHCVSGFGIVLARSRRRVGLRRQSCYCHCLNQC